MSGRERADRVSERSSSSVAAATAAITSDNCGAPRAAGAVARSRVLVVDRDAECAVVTSGRTGVAGERSDDRVDGRRRDWRAFFKRYLDDAAA